jgi:hypothetical protein
VPAAEAEAVSKRKGVQGLEVRRLPEAEAVTPEEENKIRRDLRNALATIGTLRAELARAKAKNAELRMRLRLRQWSEAAPTTTEERKSCEQS